METEITIGGGSYETTINDIKIGVKPLSLKIGEDVMISVIHNEDKNVSITLSSESLDFEEVIETPKNLMKKILIEGTHDLIFTYKSGGISSLVSTSINVFK